MLAAQILEAAMLICFGLSWPINAYKNYKAETAAGTSWQFILLITAGYVAGIAAKFCADAVNWVLVVYFLNLACLGLNWGIYFRNRRLDRERMSRIESESFTTSVKNLLIATDGSKPSLDAIAFATHAINLKGMEEVEVLSVARPGNQTSNTKAHASVHHAEDVLNAEGIECTTKVVEGDFVGGIVQEAQERGSSLIVMGSRGVTGVKGFLLGSVSKGVSENVKCPVLIVK